MVKSTYSDIKVSGLSVVVPTKWTPVEEFIDNSDEENIKKFKKNTGVEGRYDATEKQTTADFCYVEAKKVMEHQNINAENVELLILVTQTADYIVPATACVLHKRLGLSDNCMAFDVNQGCAGLVYGLNIACAIMETSNMKTALLLAGDTLGKSHRRYVKNGWVAENDNDSKLFGDAGMAMLLCRDENASQIDMAMRTDGNGYKSIIKPWSLYRRDMQGVDVSVMNSIDVFNFAIDKPPILIKELMEEIGTTPEEYDCLVLHQANKFIMQQVARRSGFKSKQNLVSIDKFGNTSSASIASALVKYYGEENEGTIKAMLCGFGIGLAWGCVSLELKKEDILPLIQTDEFFDDGFERCYGGIVN